MIQTYPSYTNFPNSNNITKKVLKKYKYIQEAHSKAASKNMSFFVIPN